MVSSSIRLSEKKKLWAFGNKHILQCLLRFYLHDRDQTAICLLQVFGRCEGAELSHSKGRTKAPLAYRRKFGGLSQFPGIICSVDERHNDTMG